MNLSMEILLAAFGGGCLAALWGAIPAFVFTGVLALIGNAVLAGGGDGTILGLAFGQLFGPHVSFAGAVGAAAYAYKRGFMENGTDILLPLAKFRDPSIIIVGGIFGVVGELLIQVFGLIGLGKLTNFDTVALTVAVSGIIVRLLFGKTGIIGTMDGNRSFLPDSKDALFEIICGLGIGCIAAYVAKATGLGSLPFAISAASLIFLQMGHPFIASHHISNCTAVATLASGNIYIGIVFGVVAAVLCNVYVRVFNSKCDTHIDPPALTITTLTLVIALVFRA